MIGGKPGKAGGFARITVVACGRKIVGLGLSKSGAKEQEKDAQKRRHSMPPVCCRLSKPEIECEPCGNSGQSLGRQTLVGMGQSLRQV
jgi:hypothetical protein